MAAPPITIMLVGETKVGKSSAWINAFGAAAHCIATEVHAIAPAYDAELNPSGKIPSVSYCLDTDGPCDQVLRAIENDVAPRVLARTIGAVAIDTITTLADREFEWIKRTVPKWDSYGLGSKTMYGRIQRVLSELLRLGVIVVGVAHEKEPSNFNGRFTPGGPKLPGELVKSAPSLFGTILRCTVRADEDGNPKRVFLCNPLDRQWITGDSWNVCGEVEPMDLREIARRIRIKTKKMENGK